MDKCHVTKADTDVFDGFKYLEGVSMNHDEHVQLPVILDLFENVSAPIRKLYIRLVLVMTFNVFVLNSNFYEFYSISG